MGTSESGKARAHHDVVRVVAADRLARHAEVDVRRELKERQLVVGGWRALHAALREELPLGDLSAVRVGELRHRVEESGVAASAPPPRELVVDEVSEEPRVVAVRGAADARLPVRPLRKLRMEHVGERGARTVFVGADVEVGAIRIPAKPVADGEEHGMHEPTVLEGWIASRAEEVEAPLLEACERVLLPVNLVRELPLVYLMVDAALSALAEVSMVLHVVDAEQHHAPSKRIDHAPASVLLHDTEESSRLVRDVSEKTVARVRRHVLSFLGDGDITPELRVDERAAEQASGMKRRAATQDGICSRKRECTREQRFTRGVFNLACDFARSAVETQGHTICLTVLPRALVYVPQTLELVNALRKPDAVAHFA